MKKSIVYLMLGLMLINNLFVVNPTSYAEEADSSIVSEVKILNEEGLELDATQELQMEEKLRLQLTIQVDEEEQSEEFIVPESLRLLEGQSADIIVDGEVVGEYNVNGQMVELSTTSFDGDEDVKLNLEAEMNEEYIDENGEVRVEFPITNHQYIFTMEEIELDQEDIASDEEATDENEKVEEPIEPTASAEETDDASENNEENDLVGSDEAELDEEALEQETEVKTKAKNAIVPFAEDIDLTITDEKEEYNVDEEGDETVVGTETVRQTGSLGDIKNVYSKVDYDKVLDIHNDNINSDHGITNTDVKARIINDLGADVKAVVSYWVDADGVEHRQITFIENGEILQTDDNQPAQHTFVGYDRSQEETMIIKGVTVHLNHAGANIDINFEDPANGKVQPGVLLDTPTKTNVSVKWVNGITGETVDANDIYQEVEKTVQTGSTINTNAHKAPEGFFFAGKLKQGEAFIPESEDGYTSPAINLDQIDLGVNSTSEQVEEGSDYHFLADYHIKNHLDIGDSYTVNLQDYVYVDNTKPIGQSDMHQRQIDLTVKRMNAEGDVELTLKDMESGDEQKIIVNHGETATYSNPNDFWHYYENNPGDDGWTVRTFHNDLKLVSPDDVVYVYYPDETPEIDKDVEGQEHLDIDYENEYNYNVITKLPKNIYEYEKFVVTDEVDDGLEVIGAVATVDGVEMDAVDVKVDGNLVTATVTDFEALTNKGQIELVITAKIKADTDITQYEDNKIPNTADLDFTNESGQEDKLTTDPVTVTPPPVETPDVEKEVEDNEGEYGKDLVEKEYEKDYNYHVNTIVPENLAGYEHITLSDELDKRLAVQSAVALVDGEEVDYDVEITGQHVVLKVERAQLNEIAGKTLTLQITAQIKADTPIEVIDNVAQIEVNDSPAKDSNVVPVTPPPTTPEIDKDVEGQEHLDVDYEKHYNYNVITKLPSNIEDYEKFVVTDRVDDGLAVIDAAVTVDGEETDAVHVDVDGNLVTATVENFEALTDKGQIELVITAKIKADTDITQYEDNKIPNTADLDFTNESGQEDKLTTDPVTVTPPPVETPDVEKEVEDNEGEYGKDLVEKEYEKDYNYHVNTIIPENLGGYEHITLTDELDDRLAVQDAVALVDGEEVDYGVEIDGQLVTLIVERAQLDKIAGKTLTLQITAQIKADTPIEVIDNIAQIEVNDSPAKDSNVIPVTPPPTTPEIDKDVEGEEHLNIDYEKAYNYNVITKLPSNIEDYEKFVVTDKVDDGLAVIDARVTVDGEKTNAVDVKVDGNVVTATVTDFAALNGKGQIELVITAKIKADTDITQYKDNKIPNTADLDFTNESGQEDKLITDPVTVTPPPTTPEIDKDVEGEEHLNIDYEKAYNYNVITKLPSNIKDYEKFVVTDKVDDGLAVIDARVTVDGEKTNAVDVKVDGNVVTATVTDFATLNDKGQIELVITAQIKVDTDISKYKDNKIPNTADLDFVDESGQEDKLTTDPVTVTPPSSEEPPTNPEEPKDPEAPSKNDSGDKLPKTATNTFNLLMIGLVVMLLGTLAFFFRRKGSQQ